MFFETARTCVLIRLLKSNGIVSRVFFSYPKENKLIVVVISVSNFCTERL